MKTISKRAKCELRQFIESNLPVWKENCRIWGIFEQETGLDELAALQITFGFNEQLTDWSFQTGDNSYSGGAYGYPLWAVDYIYEDTNTRDMLQEIVDQIEDIANQ